MENLETILGLYGKDKLNTLTKYPSILTLHKLGEKGCLTSELTTPSVLNQKLFGSEKIDGTNTRILCYKGSYIIGSREFLLHLKGDKFYDPAQGIVDGLTNLDVLKRLPYTEDLTVVYGEFFGGKVSSNSKQYGCDNIGFRVFDVAVYDDLSILDKSLAEISSWRERETSEGIIYGQNYLTRKEISYIYGDYFELVPVVSFDLGDLSHETILENLIKFIPETNVALSESALKKPEGVVLRSEDRKTIVKVRYEDYERTLRKKNK